MELHKKFSFLAVAREKACLVDVLSGLAKGWGICFMKAFYSAKQLLNIENL